MYVNNTYFFIVLFANMISFQAIERANSASSDWKDGTTASHRSAVLSKWSSLIKENADDIGKFCFIA